MPIGINAHSQDILDTKTNAVSGDFNSCKFLFKNALKLYLETYVPDERFWHLNKNMFLDFFF